MDRQRQAQLRHHRRQPGERPVVGGRFQVRIVDAGRVEDLLAAEAERISEVRLEADRARGRHLLEILRRGARADQTPQAEVDSRLAVRERGLRLEHARAVDRRHGVRHVDHDGHPAGSRRIGQAGEVFLLGKARVSAVDVDVDRSGKHVHPSCVEHFSGIGGQARLDAHDHPVADEHVDATRALGRVDGPALDQELSQVPGLEFERAASRQSAPRECFLRRLPPGPARPRDG